MPDPDPVGAHPRHISRFQWTLIPAAVCALYCLVLLGAAANMALAESVRWLLHPALLPPAILLAVAAYAWHRGLWWVAGIAACLAITMNNLWAALS